LKENDQEEKKNEAKVRGLTIRRLVERTEMLGFSYRGEAE